MAGTQIVAAELSPELSPTWQVEGPTAEWDFLKAVRLVSASTSLSPVAGQTARYALINPANSGMIATVSSVRYSSGNPSRFLLRFIGVALAPFATLAEAGARDSRWGAPGTTISPITFSAENNAAVIAGGFEVHDTRVLADSPFSFNEPVVLAPGSSLFWGSTFLNFSTSSSVHWSERRLPALEQ